MQSLPGRIAEEREALDYPTPYPLPPTHYTLAPSPLTSHLSPLTLTPPPRMAEERTALEARLAETSRRSEAKLRAERTRLAVRYGNQGKQLVQQKMGELQLGSSDPLEQQD